MRAGLVLVAVVSVGAVADVWAQAPQTQGIEVRANTRLCVEATAHNRPRAEARRHRRVDASIR